MDWSFSQMLTVLLFFGAVVKLESLYQKNKSKWFRALLYLVTAVFIFAAGITKDRGWTSGVDLPDEFIFIKGVVQEPTENSDGRIFMWIRIAERPNEPFSVELPYDADVAEQVLEIDAKARKEGEIAIALGTAEPAKRKTKKKPASKQKESLAILHFMHIFTVTHQGGTNQYMLEKVKAYEPSSICIGKTNIRLLIV